MNYYSFLPFLHDYETNLCKDLHINSPKDLKGPIIAIGGFSGVGKDTFAINLRDKLRSHGITLNIYG